LLLFGHRAIRLRGHGRLDADTAAAVPGSAGGAGDGDSAPLSVWLLLRR